MHNVNYKAMDDPFSFVPHHMRDSFQLWIEDAIPPGSFGRAVLTNDLAMAFGKADHINQNHIGTIVAWLWNFAPTGCWGSEEKFNKWKGLNQ